MNKQLTFVFLLCLCCLWYLIALSNMSSILGDICNLHVFDISAVVVAIGPLRMWLGLVISTKCCSFPCWIRNL